MTDNRMNFEQFETIYNTNKELITCVQKLFKLSEGLDSLPGYLFADICRMHNAAVDFIDGYTKYLENKEEN